MTLKDRSAISMTAIQRAVFKVMAIPVLSVEVPVLCEEVAATDLLEASDLVVRRVCPSQHKFLFVLMAHQFPDLSIAPPSEYMVHRALWPNVCKL